MTKYKKVSRTKNPTLKQISAIATNIQLKLKINYVSVNIRSISHDFTSPPSNIIYYNMAFQPGLDSSNCSIDYFDSWDSLLDRYFKIINED